MALSDNSTPSCKLANSRRQHHVDAKAQIRQSLASRVTYESSCVGGERAQHSGSETTEQGRHAIGLDRLSCAIDEALVGAIGCSLQAGFNDLETSSTTRQEKSAISHEKGSILGDSRPVG